MEVVVKGLPNDTDEFSLQNFFGQCGEITRVSLPRGKDGCLKGAAFVGFVTQEGLNKALELNSSFFNNFCISVRLASDKIERGGKKSNDEMTVVMRDFPFEGVDEAMINDYFKTCGEVVRVNLPRHKEDGRIKGAAFIEFMREEDVETALLLNGSEFMGEIITVRKASDREKGGGKGSRREREDAVTIVVKGFPTESTDEELLRSTFAAVAQVVRVNLPRGADGLPKGTAFIQMGTDEDVARACELDNSPFMNATLSVHRASDKSKRARRARIRARANGEATGSEGRSPVDSSAKPVPPKPVARVVPFSRSATQCPPQS
eukprot:gb/GFBE01004155.1/.p1 GENE.gb/GFBE01004155.1/~~gb/GFBE01004155.1/.p1  ORF type:complete len:319 (+),score=77.02 gb/GFBE01004155.1/:1-957(+)